MNKLVLLGIVVFLALLATFSVVYINRIDNSIVNTTIDRPVELPLGKELPKLGPVKCSTQQEKLNDPDCRWMDDALRGKDRP